MKRILFMGASLLLSVAFATSAQAVSFDLTGSNASSMSMSFTQGSLTATATGVDGSIPRPVTRDSQGLGINGIFDINNQIDGIRANEALTLSFSDLVVVNSVTLSRVFNGDGATVSVGGNTLLSSSNLFASATNNVVTINFGGALAGRTGSSIVFGVAGNNDDYAVQSVDVTVATPEPGTIFLFGSGLAGLGFWRLRKSTKA